MGNSRAASCSWHGRSCTRPWRGSSRTPTHSGPPIPASGRTASSVSEHVPILSFPGPQQHSSHPCLQMRRTAHSDFRCSASTICWSNRRTRWRSASHASSPASRHTTRISTSAAEGLYLRANIKPLCRFIKFVRRERDHDRINGYDNVNQLFWYPEDIARTVLTDKVCQPFMTRINVLISLCQTRLFDIPPAQRLCVSTVSTGIVHASRRSTR